MSERNIPGPHHCFGIPRRVSKSMADYHEELLTRRWGKAE